MPDFYGFPVKTKSNAGPRIKWTGGIFETPEEAIAFGAHFDVHAAANNGKMAVNLALVRVPEEAYEIPSEQMDLVNEIVATYKLSYIVDGVVLGQRLVSIPCLTPEGVTEMQTALQRMEVEYVNQQGQLDWAYPTLVELISQKMYEV